MSASCPPLALHQFDLNAFEPFVTVVLVWSAPFGLYRSALKSLLVSKGQLGVVSEFCLCPVRLLAARGSFFGFGTTLYL